MIDVVEFKVEHCQDLVLQDAQSISQSLVQDAQYAGALASGGPHFSLLVDGLVVGCAGVFMMEECRGVAWALIAKGIDRNMYHMHKAVKRFLDECGIQRVETPVDYDFLPGHRWMRLLGFEAEGVMRKYYPNGNDAILYARVQ